MEVAARPSRLADAIFCQFGRAVRHPRYHQTIFHRSIRVCRATELHESTSRDELRSPCGLISRVLKSADERRDIAELRKLAAFGVEKDLGLDLTHLEDARDELGIVTAVYRDQRVIATIRLVPAGHGLTAAERMRSRLDGGDAILAHNSWEIGRIIMAPEDRDPALLPQCLGLTLSMLLQHYLKDAQHFHASTTLAMARLWRRFGMTTALTTQGASGMQYALVHGHVAEVARMLQIPASRSPHRQALLTSAGPGRTFTTPAFS
jgi:predicted GNAT family N-acyltransferase